MLSNLGQSQKPVFLLQAHLVIPTVQIRPNVDQVQEALNTAGEILVYIVLVL